MDKLIKRKETLPDTIDRLHKYLNEGKAELSKRITKLRQLGLLKREANYLYFIQSIEGGPIKIGKTSDLDSRLESLQGGSPYQLQFVRTAKTKHASKYETFWHRLFKQFQLRNEWYDPIVLYLYDKIIEKRGGK